MNKKSIIFLASGVLVLACYGSALADSGSANFFVNNKTNNEHTFQITTNTANTPYGTWGYFNSVGNVTLQPLANSVLLGTALSMPFDQPVTTDVAEGTISLYTNSDIPGCDIAYRLVYSVGRNTPTLIPDQSFIRISGMNCACTTGMDSSGECPITSETININWVGP